MANVIYRDIPTALKAFTRENPDGSYTIVLNSRMSYDTQLRAYRHEIEHINNGDHDRSDSVDKIERKTWR